MKKIGICGHFGGDKVFLDGQTIKTKTITNALQSIYGSNEINKIDTYYARKNIVLFLINLMKLHKKSQNIILFPGQNSLIFCAFVLTILNMFHYRPIHYIVIGGWLPNYISQKKWLKRCLIKFKLIYVETNSMKQLLYKKGITNSVVMPNTKELNILSESNLLYPNDKPFKLCTFSRVIKEKGIEDAINEIKKFNDKHAKLVYTLDIYGQIDSEYKNEFKNILNTTPNYIQYKGLIPFDKSVDILKNYYALLFPTYYKGEGLAGTLIDAMSSGVPVIASDWKYNTEIIKHKYTGLIFKTKNNIEFAKCLEWIYIHQDEWNSFRKNCIKEAKKYSLNNIILILTKELD